MSNTPFFSLTSRPDIPDLHKQFSWGIKTFGKNNFECRYGKFYFRREQDRTMFLLKFPQQ